MKIKANLLKYKDPATGGYTPIPVVVSGEDIANKQDKVDNALKTNDKTIVGAINELSDEIVNQGKQVESNKNSIVGMQKAIDDMTSLKAEGNTLEEQLAWLEANGDTTKEYLCIDGYYYACVYQEGKPLYTNQLPLATDSDRKTIYSGIGYKDGYRLNSSGEEKAVAGYMITGFIPCKKGDIIRVKNFVDQQTRGVATASYSHNLSYYDSSNNFLGRTETASKAPTNPATGWTFSTDTDGEVCITIDTSTAIMSGGDNTNCNAFRFMAGDWTNSIITINEEIVEGTTEGSYVWESTGKTNASTNYEERIVLLENDVEDMQEQLANLEDNANVTYINPNIKVINHRGYNTIAPENTLSAYRLSKKMGFDYVEADISQTSDGVAVLLHDNTIDRTSNGSGTITEMTFEQVRAYDFGSWKSSAYVGEKIPTFEEFIVLCKNLGLHPYLDIKDGFSREKIAELVAMVIRNGMKGNVTWLGSTQTTLEYVRDADASARLGLVRTGISDNTIATATALRNDTNEVFLDVEVTTIDDEALTRAITNDFQVEVWTATESDVLALDPYVTGYTTDDVLVNKVFYEANIN